MVRDCVDKDWLDADPFSSYKVKHVDPKVPHLTAEELKLLEIKEILFPASKLFAMYLFLVVILDSLMSM